MVKNRPRLTANPFFSAAKPQPQRYHPTDVTFRATRLKSPAIPIRSTSKLLIRLTFGKCYIDKTGCLEKISKQGRFMALAATKTPHPTPSLGFLTVLDYGQEGLFGGYLTINLSGRPLEFHCTAPIKPNRAQEILYGPTLEPYLYGEQIGLTLLAKAASRPLVVCTDRQAALSVRDFVDVPVALVIPPQDGELDDGTEDGSEPPAPKSQKTWRIDSTHADGSDLAEFHLGRNHLAVPTRLSEDRRAITERLHDLGESFDLSEPFARIREAIEEARRGGR